MNPIDRAEMCRAPDRDPANFTIQGQRGVTLVVSLMFLLLLTILGVTSMTTGTLQEKMAGNARDLDIATQAAESALRYAEEWFTQTYQPPATLPQGLGTVNGIWPANTVGPTQIDDPSWWAANGRFYKDDGTKQISEAAEDPRFVIERMESVLQPDMKTYFIYYRITARGVGASDRTQTVLQSHFRTKERP
jgi:type IV pilus assembly protein PilX